MKRKRSKLSREAISVLTVAQEFGVMGDPDTCTITPEHLLLALATARTPVRPLLECYGLTKERITELLGDELGWWCFRECVLEDSLNPSPDLATVLRNAREEAQEMGSPSIGPEHLLLSLIREKNSVPARMLVRHGLDFDTARRLITQADFRQMPDQQIPQRDLPLHKEVNGLAFSPDGGLIVTVSRSSFKTLLAAVQ